MATISQQNVIFKFIGDGKQLTKTAKEAERQISGLNRVFDQAKAQFAGLFAFDVAQRLSAGIQSVANSAVNLAISAEQTQVAFETFLGSAEAARDVIAQLNEFSELTPFEPEQVIRAGQSLLAFGVPAEDLVDTLQRLGDVSAGTGTDFNELSEIFGKARVQGRLFAEDINQLTGRGIPIIGEFAKQFGVAESEVRKLVENGQIGFQELEQAFISLTSEGGKFFDLTSKQSQTLGGRISTLIGNFNALLRTIGERLTPALSVVVDALSSITRTAKEFIAVPLSERLEEQRIALNGLVLQITDANNSEEERLRLIKELNSEYPDFLGNLNEETVTNEQLNDRLKDVNEQLINRIILQEKEEELTEARTTAARKQLEVRERALKVNADLIKVNKGFNVNLDEANTLQERFNLLFEQAKIENRTSEIFGLAQQIGQLNNEELTANLLTEESNRLNEEKEQLAKDLGLTTDALTDANKRNNEVVDTGIKLSDKQIKQIEKERKEREKAFFELQDQLLRTEQSIDKQVEAELDAITKQLEARDKLREELARGIAPSEEADLAAEESDAFKRASAILDAELRAEKDKRNESLEQEKLTAKEKEKILEDFALAAELIEIKRLEAELDTLDLSAKEFLDKQQEIEDRRSAIKQKGVEKRIKLETEATAKILESTERLATAIINSAQQVLQTQLDGLDTRIEAQEEAIQRALTLTRDASSEQVQIEEDRLDELVAQRNRAAQQFRTVAQIEAVATQALAISKGILAVVEGFDKGIVEGIATSVALAATIASSVVALNNAFTEVPAFAEGTERVVGPGTATSDSIPAMLSAGERVVPTRINNKYFDTLNEFQNDTPMAGLLNSIAKGEINLPMVSKGRQASGQANDNSMLNELKGIKKQLSKLDISVRMDKDGFSASISKYMDNKNRFKRKAGI